MTVCNMAIEPARPRGMVAVDEHDHPTLKAPRSPRGIAWDRARCALAHVRSDPHSNFDRW